MTTSNGLQELTSLLFTMPPARRGSVLQCAVSFRPCSTIEDSFAVASVRAAFANYWEEQFHEPVSIQQLRRTLEAPVPIKTVLAFSKLNIVAEAAEIKLALSELVSRLAERIRELNGAAQLDLFENESSTTTKPAMDATPDACSVSSLQELIAQGRQYPTIYADPPWPYENGASRAAAVDHYSVLSIEQICEEPVEQLAADNAHLHLWTTNAFLREAFEVMEAWGFGFKSCLVWVKDEIGMGNYWRVSHEFLLLGVRGKLTFQDRTLPSWIKARRTTHSRKPGAVRALIEKASPAPYLELYGREEFPNSAWTVFGNQVEKRLF